MEIEMNGAEEGMNQNLGPFLTKVLSGFKLCHLLFTPCVVLAGSMSSLALYPFHHVKGLDVQL